MEKTDKQLKNYFYSDWQKFYASLKSSDRPGVKKAAFNILRGWFAERFPSILPPNDEQAAAIMDDSLNTLITARAGSGKTTLLIYKVLFLTEHRKIEPSCILLLAFNKSASVLLRERLFKILAGETAYQSFLDYLSQQGSLTYQQRDRVLKNALCFYGIRIPQIMTFHALAYQIVKPSSEQFFITDDCSSLNNSVFFRVLNRKIKDPDTLRKYVELMLSSFSDREQKKADFFYTADGKIVSDVRDQNLGNLLVSYNLPYIYKNSHAEGRGFFQIVNGTEPLLNIKSWSDALYSHESQGKGVITLSDADFDFSDRIKPESQDEMIRDLENIFGCEIRKSEDLDIFSRATFARERMLKAFQNLILICKQKKITPEKFNLIVKDYVAGCDTERLFDSLFRDLYESYEEELDRGDCYDFLKLFSVAEQKLATDFGKSFFTRGLSHIFVDEFQDFSTAYYELLKQIRRQASGEIHLTAVGDNWQSINGYSGAELSYFTSFEKYFEQPNRLNLLSNYRSSPSIISISNELMKGRGAGARAVVKSAGTVCLVHSTAISSKIDVPVKIAEIAKYLDQKKENGESVIVLVRTQSEIAKLNRLLTGKNIKVQTVHSYKGGEADYVIVNVSSWFFPLIHPDSVYLKVVGLYENDLVEEERRLLYVAMTRARKKLYLLAPSEEKLSPFVSKLNFKFDPFNEQEVLKSISRDSSDERNCITAVISGKTYPVKEQLKSLGYRFDPEEKSWSKRFADQHQFEMELCTSKIDRSQLQISLYNYCNQPIRAGKAKSRPQRGNKKRR